MFFNLSLATFIVLCTVVCALPVPSSEENVSFDLFSRQLTVRTREEIIADVNKDNLPTLEKNRVIDAAIKLVSEMNPHLFLQLNFLDYDAVADLRALRARTSRITNFEFHSEMIRIHSRMDDLHTAYLAPASLSLSIAALPFQLVEFYEGNDRTPRYLRAQGRQNNPLLQDFPFGSEVLTFDGVPVSEVARLLGVSSSVANVGARLSRSEAFLTVRQFAILPPPEKDVASLEYIHPNGTRLSINVPWQFLSLRQQPQLPPASNDNAVGKGVNQRIAFSEQSYGNVLWRRGDSRPPVSAMTAEPLKRESIGLPGLQNFLELENIETESGSFSRLIIKSFNFGFSSTTLDLLSRRLSALTTGRLVADVRQNNGGNLLTCAILYMLITTAEVPYLPLVTRATPTTTLIAQSDSLDVLRFGVADARRAGEPFCGPTSDLLANNAVGDRVPRLPTAFSGDVITLNDGNSYSAADYFSAWMKDKDGSLVVGTHSATGGGGATVLRYSALQRIAPNAFESRPLPLGIDLTTAFIRAFRHGRKAGAFLEYSGVEPDVRYFYSRFDALNNDDGLFNFLGEKFAEM